MAFPSHIMFSFQTAFLSQWLRARKCGGLYCGGKWSVDMGRKGIAGWAEFVLFRLLVFNERLQ